MPAKDIDRVKMAWRANHFLDVSKPVLIESLGSSDGIFLFELESD